jgi:hypothetical protein
MPLDTKAPEPKWVYGDAEIFNSGNTTGTITATGRISQWECPEGYLVFPENRAYSRDAAVRCVAIDPKGSDE